jgi:hypothetical protein
MPRARSGEAAMPPTRKGSAQQWLPDLRATELLITASAGKIHLSAVVDNIGLGTASGPFKVSVWAAIYTGDGGITEISQDVEVPQGVTLHGTPVFEAALVNPGTDVSIFTTRYVTSPIEIPLYYVDVAPFAQYTAGFLVDSGFQVSEVRRDNDYYTWPGRFWFVSPAGKQSKKAAVTQVPPSRVRQ